MIELILTIEEIEPDKISIRHRGRDINGATPQEAEVAQFLKSKVNEAISTAPECRVLKANVSDAVIKERDNPHGAS